MSKKQAPDLLQSSKNALLVLNALIRGLDSSQSLRAALEPTIKQLTAAVRRVEEKTGL